MLAESLTASSLEEAVIYYQKALENSSVATDWLAGRGIDLNVALTARLGWVSDPVSGYEAFVDHICIPYDTPSGVRAVKFRRIDGGKPKYTAPLGQQTRMYNVKALANTDTIVICEGEIDTIIMHHIVGVNAVGISGVGNWKPHFPRVLRGFQNIIVVVDNDEKEDGSNPGQDLARRIIEAMPRARNVLLPKGMDVNDFYLAEGPEAVRERIGVHA